MKQRALPQYVAKFQDRHGKTRYRFRRAGYAGGYFSAPPTERAFWEEYKAFMIAKTEKPADRRTMVAGSVDDLLARYYRSTDYTGEAQAHTLEKRRAILEAFRAKHGHRPVKTTPYEKLDAYIALVSKKTSDGKGGPFAAETARKVLTRLFSYAVKLRWRSDNPMDHVSYRPKKTPGFHSWAEEEIDKYREHWALGTKQRLALELMLWTGKRRSDAVTLGPQHLAGDQLAGRDKKTGKAWSLPMAPQLRAAIEAMPKSNHLCFVPSDRGRAYSAASFGNMFRQWCDDAELPHCSAHGLRKAISRRMADLGISNAGIKAVTLHSRDEEVALYVAAADQKRLGKSSIAAISDWEAVSNRSEVDKSNWTESA